MNRPGPDSPPTYDDALRIAREIAQDPGTLVPYAHRGLESARHGGGFAFLQTLRTDRGETDGYVLVTATAHASGVLSMSGRDIDSVIGEHLAKAEHDNRDIPDSELSVAHRIALDAHLAGCTSIGEMPESAAIDAETADYAEFVLIYLRSNGHAGLPGRKALARNDFLLQDPVPGRRYTQPCRIAGGRRSTTSVIRARSAATAGRARPTGPDAGLPASIPVSAAAWSPTTPTQSSPRTAAAPNTKNVSRSPEPACASSTGAPLPCTSPVSVGSSSNWPVTSCALRRLQGTTPRENGGPANGFGVSQNGYLRARPSDGEASWPPVCADH